MTIPSEVYARLPKASLVSIMWNTWSHYSRWYIARFRLANAYRYDIGPITILHRAPWIERSARQIHPHLFAEHADNSEQAKPACPYCGTTEGLRVKCDGSGYIAPEYTCEGCFTATDTGPCFDDLPVVERVS